LEHIPLIKLDVYLDISASYPQGYPQILLVPRADGSKPLDAAFLHVSIIFEQTPLARFAQGTCAYFDQAHYRLRFETGHVSRRVYEAVRTLPAYRAAIIAIALPIS
jgi:hypothetical protein